jgi:hypothetical protein
MNLQDQSSLNRPKVTTVHLSNAADWHGVQAVKAYRRKDMDAFVRHVRVADQLWADVRDLG